MTRLFQLSFTPLMVAVVAVALVMSVPSKAGATGFWASIKELKNLKIDQVDLSKVKDGEYQGEYDGGLVHAVVRVKVASGRLTEVRILKHENGLGRKAETIVNTVVKAQSLEVDAVSGATHSSKVILKAIELALTKGISS